MKLVGVRELMWDLPPDEFARTYGWYQNLLNLLAANLYEEYGLDFLRMVRARLPWESLYQEVIFGPIWPFCPIHP